jgi:integrase
MDLLGHSEIRVTMELYSHVAPVLQREVADEMEALLKTVKARASERLSARLSIPPQTGWLRENRSIY